MTTNPPATPSPAQRRVVVEGIGDGWTRFGSVDWLYERSETLAKAIQRNIVLQILVLLLAAAFVWKVDIVSTFLEALKIHTDADKTANYLVPRIIPVLVLYLFLDVGYSFGLYLRARFAFIERIRDNEIKNVPHLPHENISIAFAFSALINPEERSWESLRTTDSEPIDLQMKGIIDDLSQELHAGSTPKLKQEGTSLAIRNQAGTLVAYSRGDEATGIAGRIKAGYGYKARVKSVTPEEGVLTVEIGEPSFIRYIFPSHVSYFLMALILVSIYTLNIAVSMFFLYKALEGAWHLIVPASLYGGLVLFYLQFASQSESLDLRRGKVQPLVFVLVAQTVAIIIAFMILLLVDPLAGRS